jgi:hypothetical protein
VFFLVHGTCAATACTAPRNYSSTNFIQSMDIMKLSTATDMGANQTVPENVEHEASSTYNAELYGLFPSLGKVANSQEERKVG